MIPIGIQSFSSENIKCIDLYASVQWLKLSLIWIWVDCRYIASSWIEFDYSDSFIVWRWRVAVYGDTESDM